MAHLKKENGHLAMDGGSGKLVNDCDCCGEEPPVCSPSCVNCAVDCDDGSPINIVVSGFTVGNCANINGSGTMIRIGVCEWLVFLGAPGFQIYRLACTSNVWELTAAWSAEFEATSLCTNCCLVCVSGHPTGSGTLNCDGGADFGSFTLT